MLSTGQEQRVQWQNSLLTPPQTSRARAPKRKAPKSRVGPITKRVKLVGETGVGKLFNDCVRTDDLEQLDFTSKADAIDDSGSTMMMLVL